MLQDMRKFKAGGLNYNLRRNNAFTLVELLVVIAIISILAGILMPALENAISSARTVSCANNIKQLNNALQYYVLDYEGYFPSGKLLASGDGESDFWWNKFPAYLEATDSTGKYIIRDVTNNYSLTPLLICPENTSDKIFYQSYAHNRYCGSLPWRDVCYVYPKLESISNPSEKILIGDGRVYYKLQTYSDVYTPEAPTVQSSIRYRHNVQANLLWADGHVAVFGESLSGQRYLITE